MLWQKQRQGESRQAHRPASLHDSEDQKVFSSVVVTDRRVLDQQLQNTIYQFGIADLIVHLYQPSVRLAK